MPADNPVGIAPGDYVAFPSIAFNEGSDITLVDPQTVNIATGYYLVQFQLSVANPAQLVLELAGAEVPSTVVGRDSTGAQISGSSVIQNGTAGVLTLRVKNPSSSLASVILAPNAGGINPVSAHLVLVKL